jgi:hypothetical protein
VIVAMFGCKTKQKTIERTKEIAVVSKVTNKDVVIDSIAKKGSSTVDWKFIKSVKLTQNDTAKTITISDGKGNNLIIKGADAIIHSEESKSVKQDSLTVNFSKNDKTKSIKKSDTKKVNRVADSNAKTTSTWLWICIGLGLISIAIFVYAKYKV